MDTSKNDRPSTRIQKKNMLSALEASLGVVQAACVLVGIDRKTHYRWLAKDPKYKAAVEEMTDIALDFAESKLLLQIKSNNTAATIFYLKTKGKTRGYIERVEHSGPDGKPIENNAVYVLPDGTKVTM